MILLYLDLAPPPPPPYPPLANTTLMATSLYHIHLPSFWGLCRWEGGGLCSKESKKNLIFFISFCTRYLPWVCKWCGSSSRSWSRTSSPAWARSPWCTCRGTSLHITDYVSAHALHDVICVRMRIMTSFFCLCATRVTTWFWGTLKFVRMCMMIFCSS
jgi:hypothetical protein